MHRGNEVAQLRFFFIVKKYRGIGLGNYLIELFIAFLKYKKAYLLTTSELATAANEYQKAGFILVNEKISGHFDQQVTEQRYEITLS